ncbi:hypothetical protein [Streptomyces anulatus]|uniref:hypothetical protein n=1 Tax=Streptomyces anulatus TaxID=1892 RepID=UPI0022538253|nr:hypothetical protein [Streptomyces anulatus]MCX4506633.1 hypothetical protein [Streptomyces anulatus]
MPDAIAAAMGGLDPEECDHMAPDGRAIDGTAGVDTGTISTLTAVPVVLPEAGWLAPDQQARLLAVTSAVTGAVRLIAQDPGTAILHGLLTRLCAVLDHAARPDGVAWCPVPSKFEHVPSNFEWSGSLSLFHPVLAGESGWSGCVVTRQGLSSLAW